MPRIKITPASVLLTSGQSVTFEASDDRGAVPVTWSVSPPGVGGLVTSPIPPGSSATTLPPPTSSATYVAPAAATAQRVAIVAIGPNESANATITLTPDAIAIVPAKVELGPNQSQQFLAIVAGVPAGEESKKITWVLSPPVGTLKPNGVYTADSTVSDGAVEVVATDEETGSKATATVLLSAPVWTGRGVQYLAAYLFLVFSLALLIVLLWPSPVMEPEHANNQRKTAETELATKTNELTTAQSTAAKAHGKIARLRTEDNASASNRSGTPSATDTLTDAQAEADKDDALLQRAQDSYDIAVSDFKKKRSLELISMSPEITDTWLLSGISREFDLFCLVLLAGCLGAFLHMSQSFSDYVGNRTLKSNWAWWYYFRPFVGCALALVFYVSVRGGLLTFASGVTTSANTKASDLNPFAMVGAAALVGMFSRAATRKLGDLFDTLFAKSDKSKDTKDKLVEDSPIKKPEAAASEVSSGAGQKHG